MEQKQFTYTIGDKKYIQRPLVLGQVNQLMATLKHVTIPANADSAALIAILGNKLPMALAILLMEEDAIKDKKPSQYLMDRELQPIADEIEFNIDTETPFQVIEDFFDCNPIASILEKLSGAVEKIGSRIVNLKELKHSSLSSPTETLPAGTPSSGDIPSKSASPT